MGIAILFGFPIFYCYICIKKQIKYMRRMRKYYCVNRQEWIYYY